MWDSNQYPLSALPYFMGEVARHLAEYQTQFELLSQSGRGERLLDPVTINRMLVVFSEIPFWLEIYRHYVMNWRAADPSPDERKALDVLTTNLAAIEDIGKQVRLLAKAR